MNMPNGVLGLVVCLAAGAQQPVWNAGDHVPLKEFTVQSHRGAGVLSPEKSAEAFGIAWSLGTVYCILRQDVVLVLALPMMNRDPKLFQHVMDRGVASFATDYPDDVMQAIRED